MPPNYSFIQSSGMSVIFYINNLSIYSCDDEFKLCMLPSLAFFRKIAAVISKDNNVMMTSLVTPCRWITIGRQAHLIDSVADEISLLNFFD